MKLYWKREAYFSSIAGGIVTLLLVLFMMTYTAIVLKQTIERQNYYIDEKAHSIDSYPDFDISKLKLKDFRPDILLFGVL